MKINLPGSTNYDPREPWIARYDAIKNKVAGGFQSYVDDIRSQNETQHSCETTTHCIASKINYLGQQDAPRKRRSITQCPGAWAGAVVCSEPGVGLFASVSQEKWSKARDIVFKWYHAGAKFEGKEGWYIDRKELERDTGFLVHFTMTFDNFKPFLKGFYNTLNGWRFDRNKEGWKLGSREWKNIWKKHYLENDLEEFNRESPMNVLHWKEYVENKRKEASSKSTPTKVLAVPRFMSDLKALKMFLEQSHPSKRLVRGHKVAKVKYGFGDASGAGFGGSWINSERPEKVYFRFGRWGSDMDESSSNLREAKNLKECVTAMESEGGLEGREIFLFTDNSTAEAAFYKGSSSSLELFKLVVELKLLEVRYNTRLHIIHVAGTRMIEQGADGLSRGALTEGAMQGIKMTSFIPLNMSAIDRSPEIKQWLWNWFYKSPENTNKILSYLDYDDWYERGHDILGGEKNQDGIWLPNLVSGNFVWSPPPALALACLEEIRKARHKRQTSTHIFICPRIMTPSWKRHLTRAADIVLEIPAGSLSCWSTDQHEPLLIGFLFPFLQHRPWQLRNAPKILEMGRKMQDMLKENKGPKGSLLREFWSLPRRLSRMPEHLVQRVLRV